jgi:DNA-binding protein H-NS
VRATNQLPMQRRLESLINSFYQLIEFDRGEKMARQATYTDLMGQIAELQSQAEALRQKEVSTVIQSIQEQMRTYNLSPQDLESKIRLGPRASRKAQQTESQAQSATKTRGTGKKVNMDAKFRHPETGATWSGRGRMPKWISEAVKQGQTKQTFAIS